MEIVLAKRMQMTPSLNVTQTGVAQLDAEKSNFVNFGDT